MLDTAFVCVYYGAMSTSENLAGRRFGRLEALSKSGKNARNYALWLCRCDCGQQTIAASAELKKGRTRSCGCLRREVAADKFKSHGMSDTPAFKSWRSAKDRCSNKAHHAYGKYGGAGITMCPEWISSFEAFYSCMGARPSNTTLDRIDNSKGYEPGNCRWASKKEQSTNSKWPRLISHSGITLNISEWEMLKGFKAGLIQRRILSGWPTARAIETLPRKLKPKSSSPK